MGLFWLKGLQKATKNGRLCAKPVKLFNQKIGKEKADMKKQGSINQESPIIKNQMKGTEDKHSDKPDYPMLDNNATLDELKRLNEILPTYQNSHR